jgi:hypothetical protein
MKATLFGNSLEVDRQGERFATESAWWYRLQQELNSQGHDLVKKIMSEDGYLVGDDHGPYYLRDRKDAYCFYDTDYALRLAHKPKSVILSIHHTTP